MTCYEIARNIMDRIRKQMCYDSQSHKTYHHVEYYDAPLGGEYFNLKYDGIEIYIYEGEIRWMKVFSPRGIIYFNLRLWLLQLDRMTK